jgi:hypothetical protein
MAHVLKDSMNHYAIEVKRGPKHVHCIVRFNGEVEFKTFPLTKMIADHEYHTEDGQHQFDKRWTAELATDDVTSDKKLNHVIDSFLSGMLPVTDKARRLLEALRVDPGAVVPLPFSTTNDNEDNTMATKTKKAKAEKTQKTPKVKAEKGYKGHRAGSRKEAMHKYVDEKKPERQDFIAHCVDKGLAAGTAASWYQSFKK